MPQLDKFIFASQFFWFFLLFFGSYYLLVSYILPTLLKTLKFRRFHLLALRSSNGDLEAVVQPKGDLLRSFLNRLGTLAPHSLQGTITQLGQTVRLQQLQFSFLPLPLLLRASSLPPIGAPSRLPSSASLANLWSLRLSPLYVVVLLSNHAMLLGQLLAQLPPSQTRPQPHALGLSLLPQLHRFVPPTLLPLPLLPFCFFFQGIRRYVQLLALLQPSFVPLPQEVVEPLFRGGLKNLLLS